MFTPLSWRIDHPDLRVAWLVAEGVEARESPPALQAELDELIGDPGRQGLDERCKSAIRNLLRGRGYKPAGRGKPASEFLAGAAARGRFPRINNVVDTNNLLSLESGWPMSVFDLDSASEDGAGLEIRFGSASEAFIFNPAGQSIDIGGLVVVARDDGRPIGNPVKDSMTTKIRPETRRVLAVIYTSRTLATPEEVLDVAGRYGELLTRYAGADDTRCGVLDQDSESPSVDAASSRD